MVSQFIPFRVPAFGAWGCVVSHVGHPGDRAAGPPAEILPELDRTASPGARHKGRHGPLRVQLHAAARRERSGFDPGPVSLRARARRLRRPLLLSDARPAGARCRRQRLAGRDRTADRPLPALFGRAGGFLGGALGHQLGPEDRRRGAGDPVRHAQEACRDRRGGRLRGPRPQVSDLGARTLPRAARGGHREGARAQEAVELPDSGGGAARSTGMMMGRDTGQGVAGGPARHIPVLGPSTLAFLAVRDGGVYIDGTFGAGGHTRAILSAADAQVIGIDRDRAAIANGFALVEQSAGRLTLVEDRFANLDEVARTFGHDAVDGIVLDVGVSSMQLDEAARGFSFRLDGPLDMRMGGPGPSAAEVVALASERDLAAIIATLGEERHARAVARTIVAARRAAPIS